jgi:hypothetical protein
MDRHLIAPCPGIAEGDAGRTPIWHVSKLIDPRRSNGERELAELSGKSLLLPKDPAFHPNEEGLEWRCQKLIA